MASSDQSAYIYLQRPQSIEVVTAGFHELDIPQGEDRLIRLQPNLRRTDAAPPEPRLVQTVKLNGMRSLCETRHTAPVSALQSKVASPGYGSAGAPGSPQ